MYILKNSNYNTLYYKFIVHYCRFINTRVHPLRRRFQSSFEFQFYGTCRFKTMRIWIKSFPFSASFRPKDISTTIPHKLFNLNIDIQLQIIIITLHLFNTYNIFDGIARVNKNNHFSWRHKNLLASLSDKISTDIDCCRANSLNFFVRQVFIVVLYYLFCIWRWFGHVERINDE